MNQLTAKAIHLCVEEINSRQQDRELLLENKRKFQVYEKLLSQYSHKLEENIYIDEYSLLKERMNHLINERSNLNKELVSANINLSDIISDSKNSIYLIRLKQNEKGNRLNIIENNLSIAQDLNNQTQFIKEKKKAVNNLKNYSFEIKNLNILNKNYQYLNNTRNTKESILHDKIFIKNTYLERVSIIKKTLKDIKIAIDENKTNIQNGHLIINLEKEHNSKYKNLLSFIKYRYNEYSSIFHDKQIEDKTKTKKLLNLKENRSISIHILQFFKNCHITSMSESPGKIDLNEISINVQLLHEKAKFYKKLEVKRELILCQQADILGQKKKINKNISDTKETSFSTIIGLSLLLISKSLRLEKLQNNVKLNEQIIRFDNSFWQEKENLRLIIHKENELQSLFNLLHIKLEKLNRIYNRLIG